MKANPVVNIVSLHPFQMTDRWLLQLVLRLQHKIDQDSQISIKSSSMNHNNNSHTAGLQNSNDSTHQRSEVLSKPALHPLNATPKIFAVT